MPLSQIVFLVGGIYPVSASAPDLLPVGLSEITAEKDRPVLQLQIDGGIGIVAVSCFLLVGQVKFTHSEDGVPLAIFS